MDGSVWFITWIIIAVMLLVGIVNIATALLVLILERSKWWACQSFGYSQCYASANIFVEWFVGHGRSGLL